MSREAVLSSAEEQVMWEPDLLKEAMSPQLLQVATVPSTKSKWYSKFYLFNWHMYSNLVRYISLFHVACLVLLLILYEPMKNDNSTAKFVANIVFFLLYLGFLDSEYNQLHWGYRLSEHRYDLKQKQIVAA